MARDNTFDELDDRRPASKTNRPRRASFFGFLSALIGVAALAVVYREQISDWLANRYVPYTGYDLGQWAQYLYEVRGYSVQAYHVAAAGAGLAVRALLWRKLLKRTRAGWPVLGLLLAGAAAGIYRYHSVDRVPGTPEHWVQVNVVERVQKMIDKTPEAPKAIETSTPADLASPAVESEKAPEPGPATPPATPGKANDSKLFPEL